MQTQTERKTIDLTPSWSEAAKIILLILESGTEEGKKIARAELMHMAKVAQAYVDLEKNGGLDLLPDDVRENLLCSAIEGGSNYWYLIGKNTSKKINEEAALSTTAEDAPLVELMWQLLKKGESLAINDLEDKNHKLGEISMESIRKAERIMFEKHTQHFADAKTENDDATTADVWFQLAVMGELVYG